MVGVGKGQFGIGKGQRVEVSSDGRLIEKKNRLIDYIEIIDPRKSII